MPEKKLKAACEALPSSAPKAMHAFLSAFFARSAAEDLERLNAAEMADMAVLHWDMTKKRERGKPAIKIKTTPPDKASRTTGRTIIDIVFDDMAFLVDSVTAELSRHSKQIELILHPILHAEFTKDDKLKAIHEEGNNETLSESHMHIHLRSAMPGAQVKELTKDLIRVFEDVGFATRDWHSMRDMLRQCQTYVRQAPTEKFDHAHIAEYVTFLEFLYKDNFTLLGYREYKYNRRGGKLNSPIVKGSGLGLLRDRKRPAYINEGRETLPQDLQEKRLDLPPVSVSKLNQRASVHRSVPMDAITVKHYNDKGEVTGESLFIGLFTSVTYARSIQDIPILRQKAETVLLRSGFTPGRHNYKALRHILERYPRDELFQISVDLLLKFTLSILRLQKRQRIALFVRPDPFRRHISALVYVPRDRFDTRLRLKMQHELERFFDGRLEDFQTTLDDSTLARVLFIVSLPDNAPESWDIPNLEARLQKVGQGWDETLTEALLEAGEDENAVPDIVWRFGDAFPLAYREEYEAIDAVRDLQKVEQTMESGRLSVDLYTREKDAGEYIRLKIFQCEKPVILSGILPYLENMGLTVISEMPFEITPKHAEQTVWGHDFIMKPRIALSPKEIEARKESFEEALLRVCEKRSDDDGLNELILSTGMTWREVMILRTLLRYLRQARIAFSTRFLERTLTRHAGIARLLVDYFTAVHNPAQQPPLMDVQAFEQKLEGALIDVSSLEEDRIIRQIAALIHASLRTNYFQKQKKDGSKRGEWPEFLAIKFASRAIDFLPQPYPYREIFVYSPRTEGIHLRGDVIARGGIRWSDRAEDFRTEVLGLMKAQQVKNSVIVPMGAKGGFIVKRPPEGGDRQELQKEAIACYQVFIGGLLTLTDNRKGKKIIPPRDVVCRDDPDPYLVVAADKGTATFSNIANDISKSHGFWLGDAFASGGSAGYDHKEMGVTARGAWESVKRHFRELNHDTQSQPFDVIGVGDMAGDVFGNGMLLSEEIRLVGAFNHLHIFCDPDPDPASSFKERQRLFKAVKGWDAYNSKKLSSGGRIYKRDEKSLSLTPEIMQRFGLTQEKVTPAELIRAMLRARTDLLWFGGIGTYIKAAHETDEDVGDKQNDHLRVNADEVGAKVIGEGANLATTQAGRISFAERGGKLNADFIDNSGGVNSSDVEVNIKILLDAVMRRKDSSLTLEKRNKLLSSMTEDVAQIVLTNSYQQAQGISLMLHRAPQMLPIHAMLIDHLETHHGLNRKIENLPGHKEIEKRQREGKGLSRPELSVIQAYAKIALSKALLETDLPDHEESEPFGLFPYFPEILQNKYAEDIRAHRLRREIIATTLAVGMVNRMGPAFVMDMQNRTGADVAQIAKAYLIVREAFHARAIWDDIEALDNQVPAAIQLHAMRSVANVLERGVLWLLGRLDESLDLTSDIDRYGKGIAKLENGLNDIMTEDRLERLAQQQKQAVQDGLPYELAEKISHMQPLGAAFDVICIADTTGAPLREAGKIYFALGRHMKLHWLRKQARYLQTDDRWSDEATERLIQEFYGAQAGLAERILKDMKDSKGLRKKSGEILIESWLSRYKAQADQLDRFFKELQHAGSIDIPKLIIAEQRLRQLYSQH